MINLPAVLQQTRASGVRHARRRPWRYLLSAASIALAVALFVSMRITQVSVVATFRANLAALAGNATHVVTARTRLDESVLHALEQLDLHPAFQADARLPEPNSASTTGRAVGLLAAPLVQGSATLPDAGVAVTILGIDPLRDARLRRYNAADAAELDLSTLLRSRDVLILTQSLSERLQARPGAALRVSTPAGVQTMSVAGVLRNDGAAAALGGNILFMPIGAAQRLLGMEGRYSRIELVLDTGKSPPSGSSLESRVAAALPAGYTLSPAAQSDATFDALFVQFQVMLICITALAALIGVFIVYNSMALAVVQRAREIGTFRALGAHRREILMAILLEAALLGLIASAAGLAIGVGMASWALRSAGESLSIIVNLGPPLRVIPADVFWLAPLVGVAASMLGALAPARTAAAQPPVLAMKPGAVEALMHARTMYWFIAGALIVPIGLVLVGRPGVGWALRIGGVVAAFLGVGMAGPQLIKWLAAPARAAARRALRLPGVLALDSIVKFPTRTSLTLVALGGSLSIIVAMAGLVRSLEGSIRQWLEETLPFDLAVNGQPHGGSPYNTGGEYPPELLDELRRDPAVEIAYGVRTRQTLFGDERVMIVAVDFAEFEQVRAARGATQPWLPPGPLVAGEVAISENFSTLHSVAVGDSVTLDAAGGPRAFRVAAIRPDYTWFRGTVLMDRRTYVEAFDDPLLSYMDMRLRTGTNIESTRARLTESLSARFPAFLYRADETKAFALALIGDWFKLANLQLLLAVFIGGVGVANCLLISLLSQSRQIGLLRAIGATPAQIRSMLLTEAAFLGAAGGLLGGVLGIATIGLVVMPLAIRAAGFVLPLVVPTDALLIAAAAGVVISLAAALLPLGAARRIDVVAAIGYE
ncbi:MAG: FtsX-like permease family protein [Phycisphaerales bacterium]|nr:FtsX-like permease family protein [Phycisphaerales bacterium]